jgi:hypothetical protein
MATIYKVEVEIVSDWINYTPEDIERMIKQKIEDTHELLKQDFRVRLIESERK